MNPSLRVLFVEDDDVDFELIVRVLHRAGMNIVPARAPTLDAARTMLADSAWDIVCADYTLPGGNGLDVVELVRSAAPDLPCVVVSGSVGEEAVAELMNAGAVDYVMKNELRRLPSALRRAHREAAARVARRLAEEQAQRLAYTDAVTHLPNVNALVRRLAERVHPAMGAPLALVLVEVVGFVELALALGTYASDQLMVELARRLQERLPDAFVARSGGRSFALILGGEQGRPESLGPLLEAVCGPVALDGVDYPVHLRAGVAVAPESTTEPGILARHARVALVQGRRTGAVIHVYNAGSDDFSRRRLQLSADLHRACGNRELFLAFQPRVQLPRLGVSGFEALLRWRHPQLGIIPPLEFIGLAEQNGTIGPITTLVVELAIEEALRRRAEGAGAPMAVNVPARWLESPLLAGHLIGRVAAAGLDPAAIELEVTESQLVRDGGSARTALQSLRDAGIRVYIDDFGTGYSSLQYLRELPVHGLKIDRSFVSAGLDRGPTREIVRAIIDLAHVLGLRVVAEGVETVKALYSLVELGCDEAQGYFFARPMESAVLATWLQEWSPSVALNGSAGELR